MNRQEILDEAIGMAQGNNAFSEPDYIDGSLAAAAPREELIAELVGALREAAEMIRSEYCSHLGACGPEVNSCYAGAALSAIAKAEARQ